MPAAPNYPPFMFAYNCIAQLFSSIQSNDTPELFTHDFLRYTLGFSREADRAFLGVAKRCGLLTAEGKPTALYLRVREPGGVEPVVAEMMKQGFVTLYAKNPAAHELDRKAIAALVVEVTGMDPSLPTLRAIVGTFYAMKLLAYPHLQAEVVPNRRKAPERRRGR